MMQAHILPARDGLTWVKLGIEVLRRQPMPMFSWALMMALFVMIAMQLPPIGPLAFITLMPAVTLMTVHACREILAGRIVLPFSLFGVLKAPGVFKAQLKLGALYAVLILGSGLLAFLPFAGQIREAVQAANPENPVVMLEVLTAPIALFGVLYVIVASFFWYAPMLVSWEGIPIRKALFFSAIACWRNKWAFAVYGLFWAGTAFVLNVLGSALEALGISGVGASLLLTPISFLVAAALYCSFYPTYTLVFERSRDDLEPGQGERQGLDTDI